MLKLCGLIFASALLCAGSAQAFHASGTGHTRQFVTSRSHIHPLNPQPLPPGMRLRGR